ncbi:MAG: hypothetical protein Q4E54_08390 [Lachnospiraceae bacterium]|nr:hypothetical protein [Lachnospiraceae bacterium]
MKYIVANPTENITVLVETPVAPADRDEVTGQMFESVPACEQVGYITMPVSSSCDIRLEMMGGEFCGNASLSTAAYHARRKGLKSGETLDVNMECSGVSEAFICTVTANDDCGINFTGTLQMPSPLKTEYADGHPVIFLPGIAHMILPADRFTKRQIENNIKDYASKFDVSAFGILRWDEEKQYMEPCVYVKGFETLIWEHGCATGSTCIGYYRYKTGGHSSTDVRQPGGTIRIRIHDDKIHLTGNVKFE